MQRFNKTILVAFLGLLLTAGCNDILEETTRERFEPGFFKTEEGVVGGLTGLYANLRRVYGQPYYYNATETGTDEYTYGSQADGNFQAADLSGLGIPDAQNSRFDVLWNESYSAINSASAIIANGTEAAMPDELIAEARFFRAYGYALLVQTFGGVPLDLGGGELEFNTAPSLKSVRNTVPEVYTRGVFPDLEQAVEDLPDNPRVIGGVTKNVARLILSKAYLTYAWWLENPNNIPTYPETDRTDPDGMSATQYYQLAYDVATAGIDNPGPYSLQPTYYDVNLAQNDRNSEIMLWADHTEYSAKYNEGNVTGWNGGDAQNQSVWMVTCYFHITKASSDPATWSPVDAFFRTVQAGQAYSRQWSRMAPSIGVFTNTFADKTTDSRFDGTFTSVYRATWNYNTSRTETELYGANFLPIAPNEPVLSFIPSDPGGILYDDTYNDGTEAGYLPGRADFVVPIDKISRGVFPGLWKLGPYRQGKDYNDDKVSSSRPYNILKFSELYFVAAEAAVKGASGIYTARQLINVIRGRAGMWRYDVSQDMERIEDNSAAMQAATPATIDINYILDERSREYFGEGYRWFDLARTQKWEEYAGTYQISPTVGDTPATVNREIEPYMYLRPIPQGQLDRMDGDEAYKDNYQNPGYE
ncbi:Starch-binding associating with outer membrane [Reichenbachiella agariperforans]|uniref:Starch-binding associating with outer membrane n=1 Tax=Reichenbachiella agariperforans TaxID=156994 RepID=A0A1M6K5T2_REIAG|nr:RagB/SusD family nutrient uptake outer membrane protein [Reichenbachiella agariperforans]SHJ54263.1 Starch-binding associating with outer membrane [Reichenbachiella agariperforans]